MTDMTQVDTKPDAEAERRRPGRADARAELLPLLRTPSIPPLDVWTETTMDDPVSTARGMMTGLAIMTSVWTVIGLVLYEVL